MRSINRRGLTGLLTSAGAFLGCACGRAVAQQQAPLAIPGEAQSSKSTLLGLGADLLQRKPPINDINMYLNGFHFYADDMGRQIEAHHYCTHVNEEFFQCVIYDSNESGARLIGVEYILSERIFKTLTDDEKQLWHSHRYETSSGELIMPSIPAAVERSAMTMFASTYGKTWHTWQIDREASLPLGIPQLMMGFTADGQLDAEMLQRRDKAFGVSIQELRDDRAELARSAPPVQHGANGWLSGATQQLTLVKTEVKNRRGV
jgi:hypothetical protein